MVLVVYFVVCLVIVVALWSGAGGGD